MNGTCGVVWVGQAALWCCLFFCFAELQAATAVKIAEGLDEPVGIASAPGDSTRLFIVERKGKIRVLDLNTHRLMEEPLLDLGNEIETGFGEQGLLGLAFPEDWQETKRYFVNYTRKEDGATVVARCLLRKELRAGSGALDELLLIVPQPYVNHNGGGIQFGPDGYLYIGMGDGGSAGDPRNNAQNPESHLGKMLRLDVNTQDAEPEQFLLGVRNPWRFDFDPETNDLFIADVGQDSYEEVHVIPGRRPRNNNLGWNKMEGTHCFPPGRSCDQDLYDRPVWEYSHREGCSITGGVVVRDKSVPELFGCYLCADYCSGRLWCFRSVGGGIAGLREISGELLGSRKAAENISSFGRDARGRVYVCRHLAGELFRIESGVYGPPER